MYSYTYQHQNEKPYLNINIIYLIYMSFRFV